MSRPIRSFIAISGACVTLLGSGAAADEGAAPDVLALSDPTQDQTDEHTRLMRRDDPNRLARVSARPSSGGELLQQFDIGAAPVAAERPAVRLTSPTAVDAELIAADIIEADDGMVEIEQVWLDLAECESNHRWAYNGSSGYDGGLQFSPATWRAVDGVEFAEFAWQATPVEQVLVAERLLEVQGWGAWPACSRKLGLR
jgi:hypothetical protein